MQLIIYRTTVKYIISILSIYLSRISRNFLKVNQNILFLSIFRYNDAYELVEYKKLYFFQNKAIIYIILQLQVQDFIHTKDVIDIQLFMMEYETLKNI